MNFKEEPLGLLKNNDSWEELIFWVIRMYQLHKQTPLIIHSFQKVIWKAVGAGTFLPLCPVGWLSPRRVGRSDFWGVGKGFLLSLTQIWGPCAAWHCSCWCTVTAVTGDHFIRSFCSDITRVYTTCMMLHRYECSSRTKTKSFYPLKQWWMLQVWGSVSWPRTPADLMMGAEPQSLPVDSPVTQCHSGSMKPNPWLPQMVTLI